MRRLAFWTALLGLAIPAEVEAQQKAYTITVTAGKQDRDNTPVCVPLSVPKEFADQNEALLAGPDGFRLFGQFTAPGIETEHIKPSGPGLVRRDLHFIIKHFPRGAKADVSFRLGLDVRPFERFKSEDRKGEYADLEYGNSDQPKTFRPVMRYWYKAYDKSSSEARDRTYKVFHHLFDR